MSKRPKMRWRESDLAEIQRVVKNFNAKLSRLEKKGVDMSIMPDRLSLKDVKTKMETRADFNRVTASLKRFSVRGAETVIKTERGGTATKWRINEAILHDKQEQARARREYNKLLKKPVTSRGKDTGVTRAEMGTVRENEVKPKERNPMKMSQKELDKFFQRTEKAMYDNASEAKKQRMKDNYIKAMINAGIDETIQAIVEAMPLDEFVNTVINDQEGTFDFVYAPEELSALNISLRETWEAAAERAGIDIDELYFDALNDDDYDEE